MCSHANDSHSGRRGKTDRRGRVTGRRPAVRCSWKDEHDDRVRRAHAAAARDGARRPQAVGGAITNDGKYLCTANGLSQDVSAVDTRANRVIATVKLGTPPWGLAIAPSAR